MTSPPAPGPAVWAEATGEGRSVVFLHGLADDHSLWRHVTGSLDGVRALVVDLPGHGRSGPIPDDASIGWMADRVAETIAAQGHPPVTLVGLSMGGGVAQVLALEHPELVRALVLVSTSPVFPAATRQRFLDRADLAEREGMGAVVDATVPRWFTPDWMAAHPDEVERTRDTVLATDPVSFARASRLNAARDVLERLGELRLPVLFVGGREDPADPSRAAAQYAERLQDVRIELLPGASHLVPVEAPERFTAALLAFLTKTAADDSRPKTSMEAAR
ncbi:MAG TPA: alpha/beta fold hydrolase [Candidatus Saccharimonadales bacterium]|nr:alpha/beta fold hydrolase [Candidatus Saccharimonadales bacterium]